MSVLVRVFDSEAADNRFELHFYQNILLFSNISDGIAYISSAVVAQTPGDVWIQISWSLCNPDALVLLAPRP